MAKMIPSHIERDDPRRQGEYMVYDWLSNDDIPGVAFYSLSQTTHEHKTMSEIDFLYICHEGLLCIEVKGGNVSKRGNEWYSINKKGEENKISDPFWQSHGCMKALQTKIDNTYGKKSIESKYLIGSAVVFPQCIADIDELEYSEELLFDGRNDLHEFNQFLQSGLNYWSNELIRKQNKRTVRLNDTQIEKIVTLLEADFGSVPSMKLQISNTYDQMLKLTDEQYDIMASIADNKQIFVNGVAGTGKSVLAVEKARSMASMNKRVLYLCFNKNIAAYVNELLRKYEFVDVKTYHALLGQSLGISRYEIGVVGISELFLAGNISISEKYDVIIMDEGQDLLYKCVFECLDEFLINGWEQGEWTIFADPNQNIFNNSDEYNSAMNYINALRPCKFVLSYNCRNTAQIARNNSVLTMTPSTKYMKLSGPKVVAKSYKKEEIVELLERDIRSLLTGGTPVKDLVILSTRKKENSTLKDINRLAEIDVVEIDDYRKKKDCQINYYTVQSFKGLESQVVFYIDIDGFSNMNHRKINYVAMSRAEILLHFYYSENIENEYKQMMIDGLAALD